VGSAIRSGWAAALCLLALSCSSPAPRPPAAAPGEWLPFEGTWTSTGTRQTLRLDPGHQASTFRLSASLLLTDQRGYLLVFLVLGTPWLLFIGR
jgi:hypothetical protein